MIRVDGKKVKTTVFPNGESHYDIKEIQEIGNNATIRVKYENDRDIIGLVGVVEHLRDINPEIVITVDFGYLPYSRMDRGNGEKVFTLRALATILNSLDLDMVRVDEVHSEISKELINNLRNRNTTKEILEKEVMREYEGVDGVYVVYPDAGAGERYRKQLDLDKAIEIAKKRDFETGRLVGMEIKTPEEEYRGGKVAIIVDDLCSKGGTFNWAASLLAEKGFEEIILVVTHIEPTILEGELLTNEIIKGIYGTDSMLNEKEVKELEQTGKVRILRK